MLSLTHAHTTGCRPLSAVIGEIATVSYVAAVIVVLFLL
jgi:hypothetical protein